MNARFVLKLYLVVLAAFTLIDLVWLGVLAAPFYRAQLGHLLAPEVNGAAAMVFYLLYVAGLLGLAIVPGLRDPALVYTLPRAAWFGFFTYATYELTNWATLPDWPWAMVVVDTLWGVLLCVGVSALGHAVGRRWLPAPDCAVPGVIRVQTDPIDPEAEQRALRAASPGAGALVAFVGTVRGSDGDRSCTGLMLEHYPGMTERVLTRLAEEAQRRWTLHALRIIHRVGRILPDEVIVLVAVTSAHRAAAFQACAFLIDALKTEAPLWKKELDAAGGRWVAARDTDQQAAARWRE